MQLFNKEIEISLNEGFSEELDIFGRKETGERLLSLLDSLTESTTIAINGSWGTGKSAFLKMWVGHLSNNGFPVIYYNSFQDDHVGDAFLSLSAQVLNSNQVNKKTAEATKYKDAATKVGSQIIRRGPRALIRIATAGVIDIGDIEGLASEAIEITGKEAEEIFGELLNDYGRLADQRKEFSKSLGALAKSISEDKPLIFIIDELDRCRPSFAVEILETVKHFFDSDRMHFVLGCNLSELAGSLKHVYGQELNANEYLQKFIHINTTLPISEKQGNDDREKYINYLLRKSRLTISAELSSSLFDEVARIAKSTKLSFRDIDRVCSYCVLSAAYAPKNLYTQGILLAGLCVLRVKHPELFEKARSGDLSVKDVQSALGMYLINQDYVSAEERRAYELWE